MTDKLKSMIDKLKKQQEIEPRQEPRQPEPRQEQRPEPRREIRAEPREEPQEERPVPNDMSNDQKIAISTRIYELQNNGRFRLELFAYLEELSNSLKDLTFVIGSLIKQEQDK